MAINFKSNAWRRSQTNTADFLDIFCLALIILKPKQQQQNGKSLPEVLHLSSIINPVPLQVTDDRWEARILPGTSYCKPITQATDFCLFVCFQDVFLTQQWWVLSGWELCPWGAQTACILVWCVRCIFPGVIIWLVKWCVCALYQGR